MTDSDNAIATPISRRSLMIGAIALSAAPAAALANHADAELLCAWSDYVAAEKALNSMSFDDMSVDEEIASWTPATDALKRITELPATTPAGIAIHLRITFANLYQEDANTYDAMIHGYSPPASDRETWPTPKQTLWNLIQDTERQALAMQTACLVHPVQEALHG